MKSPPREGLWRALTPQMFRLGLLRRAMQEAEDAGREPTDEAQAVEWLGLAPRLIAGNPGNIKITTVADLALAEALLAGGGNAMQMRTGSGFDVHAFGPGEAVMLGGVKIPCKHGVVAHSDGDVLLHALTDALLGAAGLGDIGQHFPDSDPRWRGADSTRFVRHAVQLLAGRGWHVVNADLTLLAEAPRIANHREAIRESIAATLGVATGQVNLKATTTEKLGFVGRGEGLAAQAVVLLAG
jgi:2-C-methyl-D-erythritol 2,4-cyclodiphosphate synthase